MIKILFSDIDGTLIHKRAESSEWELNSGNLPLLGEVHTRIPFYLSTGRSLEDLTKVPYIPCKGTIIEMGAYIKEKGEFDPVWQNQFTDCPKSLDEVKAYLEKEGAPLIRSPYTLRVRKDLIEADKAKTLGIKLIDLCQQAKARLKMVETTYHMIVMPLKASKENAVRYLCTKNGVDINDAAYLGDGKKDLNVMQLVKFPITLSNARQVIKDLVRQKEGFISAEGYHKGTEQALTWVLTQLNKC